MKTQDNEPQASHTPGPWKVRHAMEESGDFSGVYRIENESGQMQVATVHNYDTGATNEANARLIASAPETKKERDELKAIRAELISRCHELSKNLESGANQYVAVCRERDELKALNAELVEACILAVMDFDNEGAELNHDTVSALRTAIAKATNP